MRRTGIHTDSRSGFSLLELLLAMAVLGILMVVLAEAFAQSQATYRRAKGDVEQFREARAGYEVMTRRLGQATLNAYWGYRRDNQDNPIEYERKSELHFVSGHSTEILPDSAGRLHCGHGVFFQAPFGYAGSEAGRLASGYPVEVEMEKYDDMDDLLNCWGYFVEYSGDLDDLPTGGTFEDNRPLRPEFLRGATDLHPERKRFRLMEMRIPSERLPIYADGYGGGSGIDSLTNAELIQDWFRDNDQRVSCSVPIAENVLAILIRPEAPQILKLGGQTFKPSYLAPDLYFDSRRFQWQAGPPISQATKHQLPPVLKVTCVALDEATFNAFQLQNGDPGAAALAAFVADRFQSSDDFDQHLEELGEELDDKAVDYRIFENTLPIRAAKWITDTDRDFDL